MHIALLPVLVSAAGLTVTASPLTAHRRAEPAQVLRSTATDSLISGQYVVKLRDAVDGDAVDGTVVDSALSMLESAPNHVYTSPVFRGFAAKLDEATLETMRNHPEVDFIEQDVKVSLADYVTQSNVGYGLAHVSSRTRDATQYTYDDSAGEGTCSYVVDTGIFLDHDEFEGRAEYIADVSGDDDDVDYQGHGTHVAGIIGGHTFGVAKKTHLYVAKMMNKAGVGNVSTVLAGIDAVANDLGTKDCPKGTVLNLSVGNPRNEGLNAAVAALVSKGVFVAVAAHNYGVDVYNYSPGSEPTACTVGASTPEDSVAEFSNWGALVDVFAPGVLIESAFISTDGSTNTTTPGERTSPLGASPDADEDEIGEDGQFAGAERQAIAGDVVNGEDPDEEEEDEHLTEVAGTS
ncbi:hypothetical protein SLS62_005049 [Diatrype stigma]|uniref:Peptidase S8/S53 domain-containing protein n=1 Tax=Diatrype stigma TaxID=117547 RepID=A0AAN9UPX7_9PEZI